MQACYDAAHRTLITPRFKEGFGAGERRAIQTVSSRRPGGGPSSPAALPEPGEGIANRTVVEDTAAQQPTSRRCNVLLPCHSDAL